jgi:hypothetical protein
MDIPALMRFTESVLFDERANADTRRQAKAILAQLVEALPMPGGNGGPLQPRGQKRSRASVNTASGKLAATLKTFINGRPEIPQDEVFKHVKRKKTHGATIEVGRAMRVLGYESSRAGGRVVYVKS